MHSCIILWIQKVEKSRAKCARNDRGLPHNVDAYTRYSSPYGEHRSKTHGPRDLVAHNFSANNPPSATSYNWVPLHLGWSYVQTDINALQWKKDGADTLIIPKMIFPTPM